MVGTSLNGRLRYTIGLSAQGTGHTPALVPPVGTMHSRVEWSIQKTVHTFTNRLAVHTPPPLRTLHTFTHVFHGATVGNIAEMFLWLARVLGLGEVQPTEHTLEEKCNTNDT